MKNSKKTINAILLLMALGFCAFAYYQYKQQKPAYHLAVYGNPGHKVGDFSFIDQTGKIITQKDFEGKIYVADYFFTTCHTICPVMSNELQKVMEKFKDNPNVLFLSHTVDPEEDSVSVLAEYAKNHHASPNKWHFVTGNKKQLYDAARNYYLLDAHQGDGGVDDFIHTQNFALIDKDKQIRGFYDGTNPKEMEKLMREIDLLLKE